jgi:hypothetical protein
MVHARVCWGDPIAWDQVQWFRVGWSFLAVEIRVMGVLGVVQ